MNTPLRTSASDSARAARIGSGSATTLFVLVLALMLSGCAGFPITLPSPADQTTAGESTPQETTVATEPEPEPTPETIPAPQEIAKPGQLYDWNGSGRGVTRIVIDTDEQKARFYNGDEQIGWTTIASGLSKHPTPRGQFEVLEKVADKRSNLYGRIYNSGGGLVRGNAKAGRDRVPPGGRFVGASMPHFMRLTYDGIGLHAGPIPHPGRPASHGCIRMPARIATALFSEVDIGTPVTIVGDGPDYGNYAARVRRERVAAEARRKALAAGGSPIDALDAEIAAERTIAEPPPPQRPPADQRAEVPAPAEPTQPGDADEPAAAPSENDARPRSHGAPARPPEIRSAGQLAQRSDHG